MGLFSSKPESCNDEVKLIRMMADGDEAALESFYERYFPRLYRYIYYRVGRDHHHTEEVVHDTFMEALEKADRYDPSRGTVDSWLITLSRNRIRSNNASVGKAKNYEQSWSMLDGELETLFADLDERNLPEYALENQELQDMVTTTMSSIPENYSALLEMKYTDDLSVRDMAVKLEKTEKSVESQLTRARVAFREAFKAVCASGVVAG